MHYQSWTLCLLLVHVHGKILLFHTENNEDIEQFDCIHHTTIASVIYCRRLGVPVTLDRRQTECTNGGETFLFQSLLERNISPRDVLQWNSSLEQVDNYASFFYNRSEQDIAEHEFLCRCVQPGTFGKFCEYQFVDGAFTFEQSIEQQFEEKRVNAWAAQRYGKILCYETLPCMYGLLCLDWRDVCNGEQQCSNGLDEVNCDLLEFNECDDDEFRCMNGMCISEEYWLDGKRSSESGCFSSTDCH